MANEITIIDKEYKSWIKELKENYLRQRQKELPNVKGFSERNLKYAKVFYALDENRQQAVADFDPTPLFNIPWGHNIQIISKCAKNKEKALFFVHKTIENNWSRSLLQNFLDTDLFERSGKAISNFSKILPDAQGELAQAMTKDPYNFDFLTLTEEYKEKDLENALVTNITKFLLELGTGFSFMGRQYKIVVNDDEFFIDLLFYNTKLHAYVVVELKTSSFKPEHLGQLSFYVSAVNHQIKSKEDNPTIGILICKDKNDIVAKYSLEDIKQPIGISEYELSKLYPTDFKSSLPTIKEIEDELRDEN